MGYKIGEAAYIHNLYFWTYKPKLLNIRSIKFALKIAYYEILDRKCFLTVIVTFREYDLFFLVTD